MHSIGIQFYSIVFEKGYVERFQCHFRLVDILHDALYALAIPAIYEKKFSIQELNFS